MNWDKKDRRGDKGKGNNRREWIGNMELKRG